MALFRQFKECTRPKKYRNIPTMVDEIRFASKLEAARYQELIILRRTREIKFFLRQVPFFLPGNIKYICDFMVFNNDGTVIVEDCKGVITKEFEIKRKLVESCYPVKIKIVKMKNNWRSYRQDDDEHHYGEEQSDFNL